MAGGSPPGAVSRSRRAWRSAGPDADPSTPCAAARSRTRACRIPGRRAEDGEHLPGGFGGERAPEVVPLCQFAAHLSQEPQLLSVLQPFRDGLQPQSVGELHHRPHDALVAGVLAQPGHERAVDLQDTDREAPKIGKRRVTRAKPSGADFKPGALCSSHSVCLVVSHHETDQTPVDGDACIPFWATKKVCFTRPCAFGRGRSRNRPYSLCRSPRQRLLFATGYGL